MAQKSGFWSFAALLARATPGLNPAAGRRAWRQGGSAVRVHGLGLPYDLQTGGERVPAATGKLAAL
jgi:hypothetical protein